MNRMPSLLFDIGNTRLKWGVLKGGEIKRTGNMSHARLRDAGFNALTAKIPRNVDTILISNVAGAAFGSRIAGVLGMHCNADVHFARSAKRGYGITNAYRSVRNLGVDRWVAMIGARAEFSTALCVIDAGTAVTIDVIDRSGAHLGGQIVPGLALMCQALDDATSDIHVSKAKLATPRDGIAAFGRGTRQAVQYGAHAAVCGAIERAAATMRRAGYRPKIVLTGGDASRILKQLDGRVIHRPNLVLQGLAFMLQDNS